MSPGQRQLLISLIKNYARDSGTETLINHVADTMGLLNACRSLFDINGGVEPSLANWLSLQCAEHGVSEVEFTQAVSQVLAILNATNIEGDNYSLLGLAPGASMEEIKSAYRKLSLLYHPDRASQNGDHAPDRFIEINRAYHALTQPEKSGSNLKRTAVAPYWTRTKRKQISSQRKKKMIYWAAGALTLLMVISIFGSISVRKRAMLAGLTEDRSAFIPPQTEIDARAMGPETDITEIFEDSSGPETIGSVRPELENKNREDRPTEPLAADISAKKDPGPHLIYREYQATLLKGGTEASQLSDRQHKAPLNDSAELLPVDAESNEALNEETAVAAPMGNDVLADPILGNKQRYTTPAAAGPATEEEMAESDAQGEEQSVALELPTLAVEESPPVRMKTEAGEKADTALEIKQTEAEESLGLQRQIEQFVEAYQHAYAQRDLEKFSSFFADKAVENEKPFTDRISVYEKLFKSTQATSLSINVLTWHAVDSEVYLEGRFTVALDYKYSWDKSGTGKISFVLLETDGMLRIRSLAYEFDG